MGNTEPGSHRTGARTSVWVIEPAQPTEAVLRTARASGFDPDVSIHRVSSLGRYLLSPKNIEVQRRLIGCEIVFASSPGDRFRRWMARSVPWLSGARGSGLESNTELVLSRFDPRPPQVRDRRLREHILEIYAVLRNNDVVLKRLAALDLQRVDDIVGVCVDQAGNRSRMEIQGTLEDKITYIEQGLLKDVTIILDSAYLGRGLFEMGGFDLTSFDPARGSFLLVGRKGGRRRACLLQGERLVEDWVQDPKLVDYLFLLAHALSTNPHFRQPFDACLAGKAIPLKLLFNRELDIRYSDAHPPEAYREVLPGRIDDPGLLDLVFEAINRLQLGVSLNYVPLTGPRTEQMFTNISVLHDMRALEPLKDRLPSLYAAMAARASATEVGTYYVLDSIEGSRHDL